MFDKLDTVALIIISVLVISLLSNNGFGACIKNDGVVVNTEPQTNTPVNLPKNSPPTPNVEQQSLEGYNGPDFASTDLPQSINLSGYAAKNKLEQSKSIKSTDLKPLDNQNSPWDQPHKNINNDLLDNVLNKVHFQQSQTLRNSSLDIRSEHANPQVSVSPWMQSTISPDLQKRGVCA
jgi:hypothetical protein